MKAVPKTIWVSRTARHTKPLCSRSGVVTHSHGGFCCIHNSILAHLRKKGLYVPPALRFSSGDLLAVFVAAALQGPACFGVRLTSWAKAVSDEGVGATESDSISLKGRDRCPYPETIPEAPPVHEGDDFARCFCRPLPLAIRGPA